MKLLTTILLGFTTCSALAQIKFSEKTFENGMLYPVAHFSDNPEVADSMNAIIQRNLTDAEVSDFCIGDYGFFQKGNHIELHLICNCIDFEKTEHKFLFFSLETGTLVKYTDLFESKERAEALKHINKLIREANSTDACVADFGELSEDLKWSGLTFRLYKDGLEVHPANETCENPVQIPWTELSTYLRFSYL